MKKILLFLFAFIFFAKAEAATVNIINVDADDWQLSAIVEAVRKTDAFMRNRLEVRLGFDVNLYVAKEADSLKGMFNLSELSIDRVGARSKPGKVYIIANRSNTEYYLQFLTAHELVHQYQASIISDMTGLSNNMWFTEGMADVLAVQILDDSEMTQRFLANARRHSGEKLPLGDITSRGGWSASYNKGMHPYAKADLAVMYLFNNFDESKLVDYIALVNRQNASEALMSIYGLSFSALESKSGITPDIDGYLDR